MAALRFFSKDETFDPGVNFDSCGEDSDCETLNNEKANIFEGQCGVVNVPDILSNDLSCQCSGTKCLCDDHALSSSRGGPNADHPGPSSGCQSDSFHRSKFCRGAEAKKLYNTGIHEFECGDPHYNLCKYCAKKCPTCPMCGPQEERIKKK